MAKLVDLESKRKIFDYSTCETRCLNNLGLLESICHLVPINPVNIEPSSCNENWPRFIVFPLLILAWTPPSSRVSCLVNFKPIGVLKLFCDHRHITWEHVDNIPPRPQTGVTKGPVYAVIRNFPTFFKADMKFRHCSSHVVSLNKKY